MARALTVKAIAALRPAAHRVEVGDGGAPGLRLVIQPSGAKSWALRYRSPADGKPKKYTIGSLEAFDLSGARKAALELRRTIGRGVDPISEKRAAKAKATDTSREVGALLDRFIARHVDAKRPTTAKLLRQQIEADIRPAWSKRKIETIRKGDITALLDEIVDRGATVSANRVFSTVRKFLNWCVDRDLITDSPARGMGSPSEEVARARALMDDEIRWFWAATGEAGRFGVLARLLLITGQRRMEVAGITDSELDGSNWTIPAARTKNGREHLVPLPDLALGELAKVARIEGSELFFTTDGATISSGWSKSKRALDASMLETARKERGDPAFTIPGWTLHDLRRTCASGLARLRQPPHVIEAVLNHKSGKISGVAAVYNRFEYDEEKRSALATWARYLVVVCGGSAPEVVQFRAKNRTAHHS